MSLSELAARCETAEANRKLEVTLFREVGPVNEAHCREWCRMDGRTDLTRERYLAAWAPNYSCSLDAALTLVPEGALWEVEHKLNMGRKYSELFEKPKGEPDTDYNAGVGIGEFPTHWEYGRSLISPALALCAAALRARTASGILTEGGDVKQAPGDSLSSPAPQGDAQ